MTRPAELDPGMLLFEVASMLARHGIVASTANPTAAREAASRLLHALGIVPAAPSAIAAEPAHESTSLMPTVIPALPGAHGLPPRRPADRFTMGRASLAVVPDGGAS